MASSSSSTAADWPMDKFRAAYQKHVSEGSSRNVAVLVSLGSFSPLHIGHLQMMHQAKARLERAGYAVLSGWISPSSVAHLKASKRLSDDFRLRAIELSVESDEFLSASAWEAREHRHCKEMEVVSALQKALAQELGKGQFSDTQIRVGIVCGGDDTKRFRNMRVEDMALIVVPQSSEEAECLLENPPKQVYAAEECSGQAFEGLSSSRLWEAIQGGDLAYVVKVMPEAAARLSLAPTAKELREFPVELDKLLPRVPSEGPWPAEKMMAKLQVSKMQERSLALLVLSASLGPAHKGHIDMMEKARLRLQERGFQVIGMWLSPFNDAKAAEEALRCKTDKLSTEFRVSVAGLTAANHDLIMLSNWESQQSRTPTATEVAVNCRESLLKNFPNSLKGSRLCVFQVCGSDRLSQYKTRERLAHKDCAGIVVVPQDTEELLLEKPSELMFVTEPADEGAVHSDSLRKAIREGNMKLASEVMAQSAARFVLAPTAAEREQMKADFDKLGVQPVGQADIATAKDKLKGCLQEQLGPGAPVAVQDLGRLLQILDPSLNDEELGCIMRAAAKQQDGKTVASKDFVDWIFNSWQVA
eukprot:gb/GFBE01051897.1/.p1 GENE.gb/GFBE01051897.1/~~gb/GFBE01051897.1/.p1  ORF type:complete len:587 (+),score=147.30 gb/GFBE01051897.1/:1-1761(+)